jgi:hypothetical protein
MGRVLGQKQLGRREKPSAHKAASAASEMGDELIRLALHGKTENIRCAAIRDGLAYAWGRPPQRIDDDGAGGPIKPKRSLGM